MGANVIGVDLVEKRVEIAREAGIDHVLLAGEGVDLKEKVKEITGGREADIVVEATGSPRQVIPALDLVRKLGQVIALGSTRGTVDFNVYEYIQRKGVRFIGAYEGLAALDGFPSRETLTRHVFKLISRGALKIDPLITHKLPADEAARAYDLLLNHKDQALGVLFNWEDETGDAVRQEVRK
jgi:threonine dehydrogenase-like Zn-dependent dehydrogenase